MTVLRDTQDHRPKAGPQRAEATRLHRIGREFHADPAVSLTGRCFRAHQRPALARFWRCVGRGLRPLWEHHNDAARPDIDAHEAGAIRHHAVDPHAPILGVRCGDHLALLTRLVAVRCRPVWAASGELCTERRWMTFCTAGVPAFDDAAARDYPRRSRTPRPERSVRVSPGWNCPTAMLSASPATARNASAEPSDRARLCSGVQGDHGWLRRDVRGGGRPRATRRAG